MSNVLFVISPTLNAFVDRKKGTTGNKIDCASKHFNNALKYNTAMAAAGGVAAGIGYARVAKQGLQGGFFSKAATIYKAIPGPVKAVAGALMVAALVMKNYFKGKIEQKYIDRAQFVDRTYTDNDNAASKLK